MRPMLAHIVLLVNVLCIFANEYQECWPGEKWHENCYTCTCSKNAELDCKPGPCMEAYCVPGGVWFDDDKRCVCGAAGTATCVQLKFQKGMNNQPCEFRSYIYDTCTHCICNPVTNRTECFATTCSVYIGGTCKPGAITLEMCFKCQCTRTGFRICTVNEECFQQEEKSGTCPVGTIPRIFTRLIKACILRKRQQCHTDYACPGKQKCCRMQICYLRCSDPVK